MRDSRHTAKSYAVAKLKTSVIERAQLMDGALHIKAILKKTLDTWEENSTDTEQFILEHVQPGSSRSARKGFTRLKQSYDNLQGLLRALEHEVFNLEITLVSGQFSGRLLPLTWSRGIMPLMHGTKRKNWKWSTRLA